MKKMLFSAIAMVAFSVSGFATETKSDKSNNSEKIEFAKNCYINVYNENGVKVGTVTVTDVPDKVSCSSEAVLKRAIEIHNKAIISKELTK